MSADSVERSSLKAAALAADSSASASAERSLHAAPQTGGVRFAPSPTGRFHIGNLRTAWISWKLAHARRLPWVVRFEDIDQPRVLAGAQDLQLADMAALGLVPDVTLVQSDFVARHRLLFELARSVGTVYPCTCSRRDVQQALAGLASAPHDGLAPVYAGTCRPIVAAKTHGATEAGSIAWRFRMPNASGHDDFIIARTTHAHDEFVPAYHWACAIDDFDGRYDLIVRSSDLATALPLQRAIQSWIAKVEGQPAYTMSVFHTALMTQDDGHRLEKRTQGVTLPELQNLGWTNEKLLAAFEKSFENETTSTKSVTSEQRETLPLSDLL